MSELNERLLISSLISAERLSRLRDKFVRADDFIFHKPEFEFTIKYFAQYKSVPTPLTLLQEFPEWDQPTPDLDAFDYYIDQLKRGSLERKISEAIEKNIDNIHNDPNKALQDLSDRFSKLSSNSEADVSRTDKEALKRLAWYEEKRVIRNKGLIVGVPTGLGYFDNKGEGWQYGNLVSIVGTSYIGKSWMLVYFGTKAYQAGNRVLMVSCEMPKDEQEIRFDAMMAPLLGYKTLSYNSLKSGGGNLSEEYHKYLKEISDRDDFLTADASDIADFEITSITQLVDKYKPDVVLIDGMEMLQDKMARNRAGWEEVKAIVRQAKMTASSRNVVVIATAQSKTNAAERMPKLKDTAYSFDIARASDIVIAMSGDIDDSDMLRAYTVPKERSGTGHIRRMKLHFNPGVGDIHEISWSDDQLREVTE